MNKERLHRIKLAGEYQRKAVRALFPEEMGRHLDVIETEMKMMVTELAAELLKNCKKGDACGNGQGNEQKPEVRKVDIL